jgi:phage shock protein PspC (stress-responsive transcriptional regulator)
MTSDGTAEHRNEADHPRRLTRSRHHMIGGVAGGLGNYFDIDPVVFRIVFVVLALFGGSGVALYLIAWLLIPQDGADRSIAGEALAPEGKHRGRMTRLLVGGLLVLAALNLLLAAPWHFGLGLGTAGVITLIAFGVLLLSRRGEGGTVLRWLIAGAIACLTAIVALATAGLFAIVAASDVPFRGGIGDRTYQPASTAELHRTYRLAVGQMTVDLSGVTLGEGTTHVNASVGIGHLVVRVPQDVNVSVSAHSGAGEVVVFGEHADGVGADRVTRRTSTAESRLIVLDAEAGVGQVEVVR